MELADATLMVAVVAHSVCADQCDARLGLVTHGASPLWRGALMRQLHREVGLSEVLVRPLWRGALMRQLHRCPGSCCVVRRRGHRGDYACGPHGRGAGRWGSTRRGSAPELTISAASISTADVSPVPADPFGGYSTLGVVVPRNGAL